MSTDVQDQELLSTAVELALCGKSVEEVQKLLSAITAQLHNLVGAVS